MIIALKILCALLAALLGMLGIQWLFDTDTIAADTGIGIENLLAMNTLRGDLGGFFLGTTAIIAMGLITNNGTWLRAAAIPIGLVAIGRVLSLITDGVVDQAVMAIGVEIVCVITFLVTAALVDRNPTATD